MTLSLAVGPFSCFASRNAIATLCRRGISEPRFMQHMIRQRSIEIIASKRAIASRRQYLEQTPRAS